MGLGLYKVKNIDKHPALLITIDGENEFFQ